MNRIRGAFYTKLFFTGLIIIILSIYCASHTLKGDFPIFYHVACIILDDSVPNSMIYGYLTADKYSIPFTTATNYSYSVEAAYLLSPLALLPYYPAKAVFVFINFIAYLLAVSVLLRYYGTAGRYYTYPLLASVLWFPFFSDIIHGQVNSFLFFLVVMAVLAATKNKPYSAGVILGLGALFKLFPIAIAMVLGLKNWRIMFTCTAIVAISFFFPDASLWIPSLKRVSHFGYTYIYTLLSSFGVYWFWLYSSIVGGITAYMAWHARQTDYFYLAAIAVPAVFLASPIIEIYHLTILILPIYVIGLMQKDILVKIALILSVLLIYCATSLEWMNIFQLSGLFLLWIVSLIQISRITNSKINNYNFDLPEW